MAYAAGASPLGQTVLSPGLAPPQRQRLGTSVVDSLLLTVIVLVGVGSLCGSLFNGEIVGAWANGILFVAAVIWFAVFISKRNKSAEREWRLNLEAWNRLYICHRCGAVFQPKNT